MGIAKSGVGFPDTEQGGVEGIPFFKVSDMNIKGNENELVAANNYVTVEQVSRKKWNVINDVPAIFFAKVGAAVMLNRKRLVRFPFLLDNNTMAYVFNKNVWDCDFGKTLFETLDLTKLTQVGALPSYNASDVENIRINIPNKCEQQKVGEYFSNLDRLITLHQRKLFEAKNNPKNGSKNFFRKIYQKLYKFDFNFKTYDWEQRKVSEVTTSYSGGTPQAGNSEYYNGTIPFIRSGEIYENHTELFITQRGLENSSAKMVSKGDILYALYGATSGEVSRSNIDGAINQAILAITPNDGYNANFLVEWFRKEKASIINKYLQGGQGNLSAQIIKKLEIPLPTFKEQDKIGRYFTEINRLITLHQREVFYTLKHIFYRCCDTLLSGGL